MKRLYVRQEICSGCRACEVTCVAVHEGCFGTAAARIRVIKIEPKGIDQPRVCRLCGKAPCIAACPTGALSKDERNGAVIIHDEACTGCAACVEACPFGVAYLHPLTGLALICDLCGGDPACVRRCPTGAVIYAEAQDREAVKLEAPAANAWQNAGGKGS